MGKVLTQRDSLLLIRQNFSKCNANSVDAIAAAAAATFNSLMFQGFNSKWLKTDFLHMLYGEYATYIGNRAEWHLVPNFNMVWHLDAVGNFGIIRECEEGGYEWTVIAPDELTVIATRRELTINTAKRIAELYLMMNETQGYGKIPEEYDGIWSYSLNRADLSECEFADETEVS